MLKKIVLCVVAILFIGGTVQGEQRGVPSKRGDSSKAVVKQKVITIKGKQVTEDKYDMLKKYIGIYLPFYNGGGGKVLDWEIIAVLGGPGGGIVWDDVRRALGEYAATDLAAVLQEWAKGTYDNKPKDKEVAEEFARNVINMAYQDATPEQIQQTAALATDMPYILAMAACMSGKCEGTDTFTSLNSVVDPKSEMLAFAKSTGDPTAGVTGGSMGDKFWSDYKGSGGGSTAKCYIIGGMLGPGGGVTDPATATAMGMGDPIVKAFGSYKAEAPSYMNPNSCFFGLANTAFYAGQGGRPSKVKDVKYFGFTKAKVGGTTFTAKSDGKSTEIETKNSGYRFRQITTMPTSFEKEGGKASGKLQPAPVKVQDPFGAKTYYEVELKPIETETKGAEGADTTGGGSGKMPTQDQIDGCLASMAALLGGGCYGGGKSAGSDECAEMGGDKLKPVDPPCPTCSGMATKGGKGGDTAGGDSSKTVAAGSSICGEGDGGGGDASAAFMMQFSKDVIINWGPEGPGGGGGPGGGSPLPGGGGPDPEPPMKPR